MNNDNNNLNGTVLGNTLNNQNDGIDTLGVDNNQVLNNPLNNDGIQEGGQFFNSANNNPMDSNNNLNSMPGFEVPNAIGLTPPMGDNNTENKENKPKKKNKIVFIILIILILCCIGFGTYYILNYTKLLNFNQIKITTKNLELELGDELPVNSDLATVSGTNISNCRFDTTNVDMNTVGEYNFTVTCGSTTSTGQIKIVDNSNLNVSLNNVYKLKGSSSITGSEFVTNAPQGITLEVENESEVLENLKTSGEYEVKIKITNQNNKTKEATAKLYVTDYAIKGFLVCKTNPQNIADSSMSMEVSDRFGIANSESENNIYSGLGFEVYKFTFSDESEYTNYLNSYNENGEITINDITSKDVEFNNKTITMTIKLDNEKLYSEYGEDTFKRYTDIKNYYSETLGRTCIYES